ncbi:MAG: TIGR02281 family clan AA aspartic protease [Rhizobiales bacterium]|nr:TIGR02281 family clan AA aspartic protease [Hyphomicrobiales bacterium]
MMDVVAKTAAGVAAIAVVTVYAVTYATQQRGLANAPAQAQTQASSRPIPYATSRAPDVVAPRAAARNGGAVVLKAIRNGHYVGQFEVNGRRIPMMIDTGASMVALSYEDAQKAGIATFPSDFIYTTSTANGEAKYALTKIPEIRIDTIVLHDVDAAVMPKGAMQGSLLGMTFLKRLSGFEIVNGDTLYLKP